MKITQYQVDAFASRVFEGNPAAVCPLDSWLDDAAMQAIAAENNLAETAFFVRQPSNESQLNTVNSRYWIRWFTPLVEVELCGHATLASAYVLFSELGVSSDQIDFDSLSGLLTVRRDGNLLELDFPSQVPSEAAVPEGLSEALGVPVERCYKNEDYVVVLESEQAVRDLRPNFEKLANIDARGVIVTARSDQYDFVNRFFAPQVGINEDPVTGSAFTKLIPFWSQQLNKPRLRAKQVSMRGGEVNCGLQGDRVKIAGEAILFMKGVIHI